MRLNLVSKKEKLLIILILFLALLIFSCSKKEKLQANTLQLYVSPSYVQLQPGGSIELTCRGKSAKSDDVDINPEWKVNPETLGTVKPTRGKKVNFQAGNQTGSGKIKVQEGDVYTEVNFVIQYGEVQNGQSQPGIIFYSDNGLNNQFGIPDIFIWSASGITPSEENNSNNSVDAAKFQRFSSSSGWFGGGIVLNKVGTQPFPVDLSPYYTGKSLKFYLRINRGLTSAETIKVEIEHTQIGTKAKEYLSNSYGFNEASTSWQEITIPLSKFSGVDYTKILLPFEITVENNTAPLTLDWDYVRWE
ncbi:MAG: hypothetical protein N2555_03890 [Endomicrobia bacterium]|nr:hypothetical protein [Endomicrobiia bacterium]